MCASLSFNLTISAVYNRFSDTCSGIRFGQHACTTRYLMKFKWTWSMLIIRALGISNSFFRCYDIQPIFHLFFLSIEIMNSDHPNNAEQCSILVQILTNHIELFTRVSFFSESKEKNSSISTYPTQWKRSNFWKYWNIFSIENFIK